MRHLSLRLVNKLKEAEYFSRTFMQGMLDRIAVSHHRYGNISESYPNDVDAIKCLQQRLALYKKTGNTEWLMDVANFAMIEFMYPAHRKAHFRPTESHESPGLYGMKNRGDLNRLVKAIDTLESLTKRGGRRRKKVTVRLD